MEATIHAIPMGIDNVYLVKDKGVVVIDSGAPKKGKVFFKALNKIGITPEEIQLIILTHGHWDHIGSAAYRMSVATLFTGNVSPNRKGTHATKLIVSREGL